MRVLIDNYRNLTAGHCGSGAMRNLIYHYTELDLPEGVIFGLGSGLDSVFFTFDGETPPYMCFGRGSSFEVDLARALGIDYRETMQADDELAWQEVRDEVVAGRPTMLSGDIFYLDYREFKVHFPAHRFVLLGFDDAREEVYVADRTDEETQTCSMAALGLSRNPPVGISTFNTWGKFHSSTVGNSLEDACGIALGITVDRMLGRDTSQQDMMMAAQGGKNGELATGMAGLALLCKHLPRWAEQADPAPYARYLDNAIVKFGTGGGFFRDHFAAFLHWAAKQRRDLVDSDSIYLAERAAQGWNDLSPIMRALTEAPRERSLWAAAQHKLGEIYACEEALFTRLDRRLSLA